MNFWFKKKKIVLEAFTNEAGIAQHSPIERASKHFPDWWKKLPATLSDTNTTMKMCNGFTDLYGKSFVLPLWADCIFKIDETGYNWQWSHKNGNIGDDLANHPTEQYGDNFLNYQHIKILSPWVFRETSGVNFAWTEPVWNLLGGLEKKIRILPGVVNYQKQHTTHINMFVDKTAGEFMLPWQTPMVYITPLTESTVEIKNIVLDDAEWKKMISITHYNPTFVNAYKSRSKCPFTGKVG
jgi:hypothetical protein